MLYKLVANAINRKYNPYQQSAVLYLHRVLQEPSPFIPDAPTVKELDTLLAHLGQVFEFAPLDRIIQQSHSPRRLNKPLLGLTFDDGYRDSFELGFQVLSKHNAFATYFISSGGVFDGILWQDQIAWIIKHTSKDVLKLAAAELGVPTFHSKGQALTNMWLQHAKRLTPNAIKSLISELSVRCPHPSYPRIMVTPELLQKSIYLSGRIDVGGHTVNHSILTSTESIEEAQWEIHHDKQQLEQLCKQPVRHFCYPNGQPDVDYKKHHIELVKSAGYLAAFTTADGGIGSPQDPFQFPRLWPYRNNPILRSLSTLKIAGETPCQLSRP